MKVLVLDDHTRFRQEVEEILKRNGHDAAGVETAEEAIPLVESGRFDVVLVDFQMPRHDGLWFMNHVRMPRKTKALLITAHLNRHIINAMFKAGSSGYLVKPFDETDLMRHLDFHAPTDTGSFAAAPQPS